MKVATVAMAVLAAVGLLPARARADTVVAPQVFVRLDSDGATVNPWQPATRQLTSLGPYNIGVQLQPTSASNDNQAVEIDQLTTPAGPDSVAQDPSSQAGCELLSGTPGTIQPTGTIFNFHGDGTYSMQVSIYTYDQWNVRSDASLCTGGPATAVSLNVAASTPSYTPWVTTPTVTVKGQYERDPTRTLLGPGKHGHARLIVRADRAIAAAAARGRLTLTLYRSDCVRRRIVNRRVAIIQARLDAHATANFSFWAPTRDAFHFARLRFAGTALVLAGDDPSDLLFLAAYYQTPNFRFADPSSYAPLRLKWIVWGLRFEWSRRGTSPGIGARQRRARSLRPGSAPAPPPRTPRPAPPPRGRARAT